MKKYNLLALAACLWMTTACSDFLELNESGYNSVEYQFSTFDRTKAVATNVYGYLKDGYSEVCSTMIDAATDDAVNAWSTNGIKGFYDGSWNTSAPIVLPGDCRSQLFHRTLSGRFSRCKVSGEI